MTLEKIIDVHCHMKTIGESEAGFLNPDFQKGIRFRTYLKKLGIIGSLQAKGLKKLPAEEELRKQYKRLLLKSIDKSQANHVVVLAFDGVYDSQGQIDKESTVSYVTNDTIIDLKSEKVLIGASVNPCRRDWKDELEKCIEAKAALIKWLPSVMGFNPADLKNEKFYAMLIDNDIPLLSHVGFEYALPSIDKNNDKLENLELPLEMGVKIIAAHCCGGRPLIDSKKSFKKLVATVEKYPNLYLDVSGMTSVHRRSRLGHAIKHPLISERLLWGSDYPVPIHTWAFIQELGMQKHRQIRYATPFDKSIEINRAMGLEASAFARGYEVINPKSLE